MTDYAPDPDRTTWETGQCRACGERIADHVGGPTGAPSEHYCGYKRLAELYGKNERTVKNVKGLVHGWSHSSHHCTAGGYECGPVVARRGSGMTVRYWCAAHLGSTKGKAEAHPLAWLTAGLSRRK